MLRRCFCLLYVGKYSLISFLSFGIVQKPESPKKAIKARKMDLC